MTDCRVLPLYSNKWQGWYSTDRHNLVNLFTLPQLDDSRNEYRIAYHIRDIMTGTLQDGGTIEVDKTVSLNDLFKIISPREKLGRKITDNGTSFSDKVSDAYVNKVSIEFFKKMRRTLCRRYA